MGEIVVTGASLGIIYGFFGLGFAATYSVLREMNFAYGDSLVLSLYVGSTAGDSGLPTIAVVLIAVTFGAVLGFVTDRLAMAPLRRMNDPLLLVVSSLGMALIVRNITVGVWGPASIRFPQILTGSVSLFGTAMSASIIWVAVLLVLMIPGAIILLTKSRAGRSVRAVAEDSMAASLMSINVPRVSVAVYAIGGALGSLAGVAFGSSYGVVGVGLGFQATVIGFIASVLGGFRAIYGALIGGLVLGLLETTVALQISTLFKTTFTYAVMVLLIVIFPRGIWGADRSIRV